MAVDALLPEYARVVVKRELFRLIIGTSQRNYSQVTIVEYARKNNSNDSHLRSIAKKTFSEVLK